ncbi:DUF6578 domain-containing protein [Microbacterium sp. P05]|uniref:DUF6578 domain-containing protein n=1 Tax=Microbacterium sp. P05 TaxID=3366948 RepID=UPI0037474E7B
MTRVWLTRWEWACCGGGFEVGDDVEFTIRTREQDAVVASLLGPTLAATVDAIESHHDHESSDRLRGRVVAVHEVAHDVVERTSLRRPGHGAPPDAVLPPEGEEWPFVGRKLGNGAFVGSRPSRYVMEEVPVPGSTVLLPAKGVRLATADAEATPAARQAADEHPPERRSRRVEGWLVDVDEA